VLAHEANVDALWDSTIAPMLRARFPATTAEQILDARGYAYGVPKVQKRFGNRVTYAQAPLSSTRIWRSARIGMPWQSRFWK